MNFLLMGHGGFYNRGCEAIVRTTCQVLRKHFPGCRIVLVSFDAERDRIQGSDIDGLVEVVPAWPSRWSPRWMAIQGRRLLRGWHRAPGDAFKHLKSYYRHADCVISIGGDNYTEDYGYASYFVELLRQAQLRNIKTAVWAASIGPFRNEWFREQVVEVLRRTDLITVRESLSKDYLNSLGLHHNVRLVADPAFLLQPEEVQNPALPQGFGTQPLVGLCVSALLRRYSGDWEDVRCWSDVVRSLVREFGSTVLMVSHVTSPDCDARSLEGNDHAFMRQIQVDAACGNAVKLLEPTFTAAQTKWYISQCAYFIGARTHSTIASLSSGVPTLSIGYSRKAFGINQDIFGHTRYVIPVKNCSADQVIARFRQLVREADTIRLRLAENMPRFRKLAELNGVYLAKALKKTGPKEESTTQLSKNGTDSVAKNTYY